MKDDYIPEHAHQLGKTTKYPVEQYKHDLERYQQSQSDILFKDWHQIGRLGVGYNKNTDAINDLREWDSIEELIIAGYELELTENSLNQIFQ